MAFVLSGTQLAIDLCHALGVDPDRVTRIVIDMQRQEVVTHVTTYTDKEHLESVTRLFEAIAWKEV